MKMNMVKMMPDENGVHERMVLNTKEEFLEVFGEYYQAIIDPPEQAVAINTMFPEECRDLLAEVFYNTSSIAFWERPLINWNHKIVSQFEADVVWLMEEYEAQEGNSVSKKSQGYFDDMVTDGWQFRKPCDESIKGVYWGTKEDYLCYMNTTNGRVEFWWIEKEWVISTPEPYSYQELMFNTLTCDHCNLVQEKESDLTPVNEYQKYCQKCIDLSLTE